MTKIRIQKIAGVAAGAALAFGTFVPMVGAQTIAELQAQINALMAQLAALQGGGAVTGGQALSNFNTNLTIGSTGTDVAALQSYLVANGYLVMPVGVAKGYFGTLTRAATAAFQAANGIVPAVGYFGPITRAKLNGMIVVVPGTPGTSTNCPTGYTCTPTGTSGGVITTPGVEGSITVSVNPSPASGTKLYENDSMRSVLGIKLEAKTSDIKIERVKIDLDCVTCAPGSDTDLYRKIAQKIYVMDGSTVLASADLNSSTVVEDGANYFITVAGLSFVVPAGETKVLTVALDANSTWDSTYDGDSWTLGVPVDGVRGVDGAGVNEYGPSTAFTRSFTSTADLLDSATFAASLNVNTPDSADVVCAGGADEDECDDLEVLRADFRAEKDAVTLTDLVIDIVRAGDTSTATSSTAYLYDGSTLVGSASVAGTALGAMTATFSDIDWTVPKDTTRTLAVKFDVIDAGTAATTFVASFDAEDMTAENSVGDALTETGSADGETISIRSVGPEFSLVSKSITKSSTPIQNNYSTSTAEAQFVIRAKAVGGDILFGDAASTTLAFVSNNGGTEADGDPSFLIYRGGAAVATSGASSTSITVPSGVVISTNSFTLQENNTVDIPVSFLFEARTTEGIAVTTGSYAVGIAQLNWVSSAGIQTSDFMSGDSAWRTSTVSLP